VSFLEPDSRQVRRASALGAGRIELFTGPYAHAFETGEAALLLQMHCEAARAAREEGLEVNAGHDLNLANIPAYVGSVQDLAEVSIGHALISDALYIGLAKAVAEYLKALGSSPRSGPSQVG
jgi:pyridoxine 5-phosphate synthase